MPTGGIEIWSQIIATTSTLPHISESQRIQDCDCGIQRPLYSGDVWRLEIDGAGSSLAGTTNANGARGGVWLTRLREVYV